MALSEIVSVSIQAGTVNPARVGFGVPLIMAYHTAWAGSEVRRYTSFAGVAADFDADSMPYKMASAIFAQNPRPSAILIGRLPAPATAHTQVLNFADMESGEAVDLSVTSPDGTETAVSVAWNTDLATTLADLKTALDAISGIGTCTVASPNVTVPATTPGEIVHIEPSTVGVHVRDTTADWDYDTALDAAVVLNPEFYVVLADCNSPQNMDKIARWCASNDRFAFFAPQYTKPSQFVSGEFASGSDYTAFLANDACAFFVTKGSRENAMECRIAGKMLPKDPGSATYAYKQLAGVGADAWTATERAAIEAYHGNHYAAEAGVSITRPGKTAGGEWIDVVIGLAWVEARMQEAVFAALANNDKIPYTDAGLSVLVGEVSGVLKTAERRSVFDSGWSVTVLPAANQDSADRTARIVRDLEFQARLAGAVHTVNVTGTVTA
jgi:hypothetical protein